MSNKLIPKIIKLSESLTSEKALKVYPSISKELIDEGYDLILKMRESELSLLFKNTKDWRKGVRGAEIIAILLFVHRGFKGKTQNELYWRNLIWKKYGGNKEVPTPLGSIDLITTINNQSYVLEFKYKEGFKQALGQILCYHIYYPRLLPGIVLLSSKYQADNSIPVDFQIICRNNNIKLLNINNQEELEFVS